MLSGIIYILCENLINTGIIYCLESLTVVVYCTLDLTAIYNRNSQCQTDALIAL